MLMRLMSKGEYLIVPKGTKFTGSGKLGLNTTYKFLSNFLCNWHELYYSPTFFLSTFINWSIDILLEFWCFYQSSEHHFPPCLHPELSTTWYDHSTVTYKFQYLWRVWTSQVQGRDCDSCMKPLLWHDIWRLRHLAAQLKLCGQLYRARANWIRLWIIIVFTQNELNGT